MNWLVPSFVISHRMSPRFRQFPLSPLPHPTVFYQTLGRRKEVEVQASGERAPGHRQSPHSRVTVLTFKVPLPPPRTPSALGNGELSATLPRLLPLPECLDLSFLSNKCEQRGDRRACFGARSPLPTSALRDTGLAGTCFSVPWLLPLQGGR